MTNNSVWFYEPFYDFDRFFDEAFNAFNQRLSSGDQVQRRVTDGGDASAGARALRPRMDLHEDTGKNLVTATFELPGLKKEDVNVELQHNRLTISGESTLSSDFDKNGFAIRERRFGRFARTLQLPEGIKPEEVKASMEDGILTLTFPKTSSELAPKKIALL